MSLLYKGSTVLTSNAIAQKGCTVVVPFREEMAKRHLKVTGDLGRVIFMVQRSTRLLSIRC